MTKCWLCLCGKKLLCSLKGGEDVKDDALHDR